ncbi:phosphopantothenoylcysteine decarboxylase [Ectobacillus antri]|jgi:phosphopantothenoylcysteine synthetase/decarboxylase|uniref:Phosphopantothenoylcysteine decarboxylase n=1 Tax=Ectobacillus antri TaxID=2486280 RepID=A0ABT6H4X5_9BACI|nr:phosphopantothenoylcysteine decarboxylase [Ectobacillus antri]MDG4656834.1 phosphopantothenoylcysteine decarboxylase [Ectobacillus antri]MDG5754269.1 phosphopantothenoylcysteine decarboxylase [Ectobacillus antri]
MKGKTILITSGGCLEKWDNVRGHTNMAKGTIGSLLAEEALSLGARVIYLHGYFAKKPVAKTGQPLQTCMFEGILDLRDKVKEIVTNERVDAVIMAAAGSDWIVEKMVTQSGEELPKTGKISSDHPPIIHFKKAPKVINFIKEWSPESLLVGFKLESDVRREVLLERAKLRMTTSRATLMVANASDSLYTTEAIHYIVDTEGNVTTCEGKEETAKRLLQCIAEKVAMFSYTL